MATGFTASAEEHVSLPFNCESCRAQGEASFRAVGSSTPVRSSMLSGGDDGAIADAQTAALRSLERDKQRVLAMVPCPTCGHRNGRVGAFVRFVLLAAATALLAVVNGGIDGGVVSVVVLGLGGATIASGVSSIVAARRGREVEISSFTPGTPRRTALPAPSSKPALPAARVVAAPPVAPPVAVPSVAPAPPPPPPEDGAPRLLR